MITVKELVNLLKLNVLSGANGLNASVKGAYVSDLLSDVMGNACAGAIWITLQTHRNVMAIASLKELAAVILVKGLIPDPETIEKSQVENIPLLSTTDETFEMAGRLYGTLKECGLVE